MEIIVGGVVEKENKYLLVQLAKKNWYGKWDLPAGHLEVNETILEGAKREILEETGCKTEITGILKIANKKLKDNIILLIMFSTKLMEENISFDEKEILDVKWFRYEEIIEMQNELRDYDLILHAIRAHIVRKISPVDVVLINE